FEHSIYLEYILKKDTATRGKAHILNTKINEMKLYNLLIDDKAESAETRRYLNWNKETLVENMKNQYPGKEIKKHFEYMVEEYLKCFINENPKLKQKWYSYDGTIKNFYDLCKHLGKVAEYNLIYRILSEYVHGTNTLRKFELKPDIITIKHHSSQINLIIPIIFKAIMESSVKILKYYNMEASLKEYKRIIKHRYKSFI
ncbi:DUF5677 domain-containing protein, partial [Gottfriedia acidiceleris]|uniref:DUF5677 domain-containing protein n=1 Tax=Gottfriedia acidiceleris TaxID=371036 RepID=UPI002FFE6EB0